MFAQLVSKQAEYAISYGNLLGNTVLPSCIAHSAYSTRFIVYMYVKSGFPLYCRFVLPCYNVARAKFKPYYRMRRKPYEYAYLAKYAVFVCIIPYGVFRLIRRSHIPMPKAQEKIQPVAKATHWAAIIMAGFQDLCHTKTNKSPGLAWSQAAASVCTTMLHVYSQCHW